MIPVIFDLDGTLIDSLPNVTDAANALLAEEGLAALEPRIVAGFVGRGERVFLDRLIAATALVPEDFDRLMPQFIGHYEVAARDTRLMPGALAALADLREKGVVLGLCTNKPRAPLIPTLEAAGLEASFEIVVAGDDLERRKPDPLPLNWAMSELKASACIYVGDSEVDAETAQRAGVPFVLFTEGIRTSPVAEIPHDVAFSDFGELPEICEDLSRG